MNPAATLPRDINAADFMPARVLAADAAPWVPLSSGKSFKPLRFMSGNRGFVELLRLQPGQTLPLHRHTGEVHVFNLQGTRELCSGERIGPGDYVYEPAGNTDWWRVVGDTPLVVMMVAMGAVEYLGDDGSVSARHTADSLLALYRDYCAANRIEALDLVD